MARPRIKTIAIPDSAKSLAPSAKIRGRNAFDDNPFITASGGFEIKVRQDFSIVAKGLEIRDQEQEQVAAGFVGTVKDVCGDQFVQIYPEHIGDIFELKSAGKKAFQAVFLAVQKHAINKAEIYLNYNECQKLFAEYNLEPPSQLTFKRGIASLIDVGFIACSAKGEHWYWTNPAVLFNGSRYTFVKQYRIKRAEENKGRRQFKCIQNNMIEGEEPHIEIVPIE